MPVHLPPVSRRRFLASAAVAASGLLTFRSSSAAAETETDPTYLVLLSDTHIDQNPHRLLRGVNPAENLDRVVKRILALRPRPAAVVINGDAANTRGLTGEYGLLAWLLRPLSKAGIPVHITMGNHDDRGPFYSILQEMKPETPFLEGQHISIVETPHVDLLLLDTLDRVNNVPGLLGEEQLAWLEETLARRTGKPILLFGHHNPDTGNERGLLDADRLFELALAHPDVKGYFYGHSHRWEIGKHESLHLVNQPALAHVFQEIQPQAMVHARFKPNRVELQLDCLDHLHPWHGERHSLVFR